MSIPNKPMSGFEKFDIPRVSPSQIGNYVARRSRWVIEKIDNDPNPIVINAPASKAYDLLIEMLRENQ